MNPRNLLKKQGTSALDAGWDFMTSNGASLRRHKAKWSKCALFRLGDGEKLISDRPSWADLDGDKVLLLFFVKTLVYKPVKVSIANKQKGQSLGLVELEETFSICRVRNVAGCIIYTLGRPRNEKASDLTSSCGFWHVAYQQELAGLIFC